jgi:hypothetical protein
MQKQAITAGEKVQLKTKHSLTLLFITILVVPLIYVNVLQAQNLTYTPVNGIINQDTTWTKTSGPYNLTGDVLVNAGVTLTIEAGVTVNLAGYSIVVNGVLQACGSSSAKILLNGGEIAFSDGSSDWNENTGEGCIIEYATITSEVNVDSAAPKISNNVFVASASLEHAIGVFGPLVNTASMPQTIVSHNTIMNYDTGVYVENCPAVISDNIICNNELGIDVYTVSHAKGTVSITNNLIMYNQGNGERSYLNPGCGIRIVGNSATSTLTNVTCNTITNNIVGIDVSTYILIINITDNNLYGNSLHDLESAQALDASNNWWGTTDTSIIDQHILDFKDHFEYGGIVNYTPFLTEQNPQAPAIPTLTLTASAGNGGSINPSGNINIRYGTSINFTVTADSGYRVASVLIDGVPATAPYNLANVITNGHNITATFELIPSSSPSPSPSATSSATPTPTSVIPEIPSNLMIGLLMLTLLGATVLARKRKVNK